MAHYGCWPCSVRRRLSVGYAYNTSEHTTRTLLTQSEKNHATLYKLPLKDAIGEWFWSWRTCDIRLRWAVYSKNSPQGLASTVEVTVLLALASVSHSISLQARLRILIQGVMSKHIISSLFGPCPIWRLSHASDPHGTFHGSPFAHILRLTISTWLCLASLSAWRMSKGLHCQQAYPDQQPCFPITWTTCCDDKNKALTLKDTLCIPIITNHY